nr:zinc finger, CCHC-type [Tanacetum cinerariifolium]
MDESISVSSIIDKLPPSWKDFKYTLTISLVQLGSHLRIEESLRAQDSDKGKGKEVGGPSVNMTEEGGKNKHHKQSKGHFKRDCRSGKKNNANAGGLGNRSKNQGQVHYKRMLEMSRDDLIHVIYENPEKCTTYRGGEYYDPVFFQSVGIIHETTALYTPQHNGVAKRKNRALKEMVNSMLSYSGLSEGFWGEAMLTACYLLNRVLNKRNKTTPYELWYKKRPTCHFCEFGVVEPWLGYLIRKEKLWVKKVLIESLLDILSIPNHIGFILLNLMTRFLSTQLYNRKMQHWMRIVSLQYLPKDIIPNSDESQRDDHSDDVPNEILKPRKALAAIHNLVIHQMNVKPAFSNGDLEEEVYMKQLKGFVMPGNEHKMCKLVKSLYGIKQAPKQWHQKFDENQVDKTKKFLSSRFSMKDMGEADVILGKPVDQLEYSRAIGCLMYVMTCTGPNIAYAVGRLSRFTSNPSRQHWKAITRVFKYLRDSSSTSRWVFLLDGGAISWDSKKQTCITSSTMESEFVALVVAGARTKRTTYVNMKFCRFKKIGLGFLYVH